MYRDETETLLDHYVDSLAGSMDSAAFYHACRAAEAEISRQIREPFDLADEELGVAISLDRDDHTRIRIEIQGDRYLEYDFYRHDDEIQRGIFQVLHNVGLVSQSVNGWDD